MSWVKRIAHDQGMDSDGITLIKTGRENALPRARSEHELVRVRHGVYVSAKSWAGLRPWERHRLRIEAFRLTHPSAVLSHESAALAHGLPTFGEPQRLHVFDSNRNRSVATGDILRHTSSQPRDVVMTDLGPATSLVDTAIDVGRSAHRSLALAVWDAVARTGVSPLEFDNRRASQPSNRATRSLAWLSQQVDGLTESAGESISRALIGWIGFEAPDLQRVITTDDGAWRTDFFWKSTGIIGEFDGYAKYSLGDGSSCDPFRAEKRREDSMRRAGYAVVRWEYRDLLDPQRFSRLLSQAGILPIRRPNHAQLGSFVRVAVPLMRSTAPNN